MATSTSTPITPLNAALGSTGTQPGYGAYGTVPTVPDPTTTQQQALYGNTNILSSLLGLSQGVGQASGAGAAANLNATLPGAASAQQSSLSDINSQLSGQLSPDTMALLNQQSAESGISGGLGANTPATNAAALRAMGLTSQQLEQTGEAGLNSLISSTPQGPQFDPSTMLNTPATEQQWQYLANELAASPDPTLAAQTNEAALQAAIKEALGLAGGGGGGTTTGYGGATGGAAAPGGAGATAGGGQVGAGGQTVFPISGGAAGAATAGTTSTTTAPVTAASGGASGGAAGAQGGYYDPTSSGGIYDPATGDLSSLINFGGGPLTNAGAATDINTLLGIGAGTPGTQGTLGIDQDTATLLNSLLGTAGGGATPAPVSGDDDSSDYFDGG